MQYQGFAAVIATRVGTPRPRDKTTVGVRPGTNRVRFSCPAQSQIEARMVRARSVGEGLERRLQHANTKLESVRALAQVGLD